MMETEYRPYVKKRKLSCVTARSVPHILSEWGRGQVILVLSLVLSRGTTTPPCTGLETGPGSTTPRYRTRDTTSGAIPPQTVPGYPPPPTHTQTDTCENIAFGMRTGNMANTTQLKSKRDKVIHMPVQFFFL